MGQPHGHSWESVHGLLVHMLFAEQIWLARWQGSSPTQHLRPEDYPTLADVRRGFADSEQALRAFFAHCAEDRLHRPLHYTNTRGQAFAVNLDALILHLANHGTHHRGELAAMLALMQIPHPEDDLLFYLLEQQKLT